MQDILKKTVAAAMIAGAALSLAACKSETTNTTTENVSMTDMNTTGTMSDNSATDTNSADVMGDNSTANVQ